MSELILSAAPHIANKNSTRKIMMNVLIALVPSIIAAIYFFGFMVAVNIIICIASCFGFELLYNLVISKEWNKAGVKNSTVWDFSFAVTGIILALNLPAWFNFSNQAMAAGIMPKAIDIIGTIGVCMLGSLVAIVIAKMLFGGIGRNFANPAMLGRVFLFLCFPGAMSAIGADGIGMEATTGATWLVDRSNSGLAGNLLDMFIGNTGSAAVGETCAVAILLGLIYLVVTKTIDIRLPLIIMGSTAVFALLLDGLVNKITGMDLLYNMIAHMLSGGILFAAVFMATDYSTSPNTFIGTAIFGVGIALFTMLIRVFGSYPEGTSFALLFMNVLVPILDKYIVPKPFGQKGQRKQKKVKAAETKAQEAK